MDDNTLERAKELDADIKYFDSICGDLKHINRYHNSSYSHTKGEWFTKVKKLFKWTDIHINKDKDGTKMTIEPHSIGVTRISLKHGISKMMMYIYNGLRVDTKSLKLL